MFQTIYQNLYQLHLNEHFNRISKLLPSILNNMFIYFYEISLNSSFINDKNKIAWVK